MSSFLEREHLCFYKIKTYETILVRKLFSIGAGDENRTRLSSLEGTHTTDVLHPQAQVEAILSQL